MESEEVVLSQDHQSNQDALADIRRSQDAVRARIVEGSWRYDVTYSAIAAVMVGGQVAPMPLNVLASAGSAVAFALLWRRWVEKSGVSVTGYSPKWARWVAIALAAILTGLMLTGVYFGRRGEPLWGLPLGAAAFILAYGFSHLWARVYRGETGGRR